MSTGQSDSIASVEAYLSAVSQHKRECWTARNLLSFSPGGATFPDDINTARKVPTAWFRGQSEDWPLLPKVFRHDYLETDMLLDVRRRAHLLPGMPGWDDVVSWYFVLQHHGFPTRLIDWTENPLAALYFAAEQYDRYSGELERFRPVVWLIHPNAFNWALRGSTIIPGTGPDEAVVSPSEGVDRRFATENIIAPWTRTNGPERPLAVAGSYVHARMYVQKSRFTVHGREKTDLREYFSQKDLLSQGLARKFTIDPACARTVLRELEQLGVSRSSLFPDLDGISLEFDEMYRA